MFYRLRTALRFARLNKTLRAITSTPPIRCADDSNVVCISHIGRRYLYMYLLAVRSLARQVPLREVIVVDDLSLSAEDKALLKDQIVGVDIRPITQLPHGDCPSGGDWEGFLLIGEKAKDSYCLLLDADTVVTGNVSEVAACIAANRSFTLGTWKNQQIGTFDEAHENVMKLQSTHVQIVAEKTLRMLESSMPTRYVRGCGGFAGFACGRNFRQEIEKFSAAMSRAIGEEKWKEWGSQQVASNYIVANTPDAVVLPYPKYASYSPGVDVRGAAFVHFIGSNRFDGTAYPDVGRRVIDDLSSNRR